MALGDPRCCVSVDLCDLDASGKVSGKLFYDWGDLPAWPAPGGPDVEEHGKGGRGDDGVEGVVVRVYEPEQVGVTVRAADLARGVPGARGSSPRTPGS